MKCSALLVCGAAAALSAVQLYVLGAEGGIGPLGFIRSNRIAAHPGNGEAYSFDKIAPLENSPLAGKKICVLGSSVVFGAASEEWAVAEYLSRRFSCSYTKEAVSGTTLCDIGARSYISRLKKLNIAEKYDLFICQLSTNDARKKLPLGMIGNNDTKTVTGAIEFIIRYVKENWNCPVVFFTGSRYQSKEYDAMVKRLLELKAEYHIGVLDLWNDDAFNAISDAQRKLCMFDPVHPVRAGYRDWWGPEIERQLINFMEEQ